MSSRLVDVADRVPYGSSPAMRDWQRARDAFVQIGRDMWGDHELGEDEPTETSLRDRMVDSWGDVCEREELNGNAFDWGDVREIAQEAVGELRLERGES